MIKEKALENKKTQFQNEDKDCSIEKNNQFKAKDMDKKEIIHSYRNEDSLVNIKSS